MNGDFMERYRFPDGPIARLGVFATVGQGKRLRLELASVLAWPKISSQGWRTRSHRLVAQ